MANQTNSLPYTKWICNKESVRDIIKQLCAYKGSKKICLQLKFVYKLKNQTIFI